MNHNTVFTPTTSSYAIDMYTHNQNDTATGVQEIDLHAEIMRLSCDPSRYAADPNHRLEYKEGHRDARHAAAELAASYQDSKDGEKHPFNLYSAIMRIHPREVVEYSEMRDALTLRDAYREGHRDALFAAGYLVGTQVSFLDEPASTTALRTLCYRLDGVKRQLRSPGLTIDEAQTCADDVESFVEKARAALPGHAEVPVLIDALGRLDAAVIEKDRKFADGQIHKTAQRLTALYADDPYRRDAPFELRHALSDMVRMARTFHVDDNEPYRQALALIETRD